jgi:iron(III) transport system substrate-binding protein
MTARLGIPLLALCLLAQPACKRGESAVLYTSVDETFAQRVVAEYRRRTGENVQVVFDSEAGKTTGLVQRIRSEKGKPRADVFWSSEIFHTILLAREGLFQPYDSPAAEGIPNQYRDDKHLWTAFGLRGRVLAYDSSKVSADELPTSWRELSDEKWASSLAFANPMFGTTYGHVAAMVTQWGEKETREFLTALSANGAQMVDGNSSAVRAVLAGRARMCMTDTDDVWVVQKDHPELKLKYLDMGDGGTLVIPNSVAMLADCANPEAARRLIDFLASDDVEAMLARSASHNVSVRPAIRAKVGPEMPPASNVPYNTIADNMTTAANAVRDILIN